MKRERINKVLQNEAQIANAERNLGALRAKLQHWGNRLEKLQQEQLKLRLESQMPLGPSTRKNLRKYVVWASVRELLSEPAGSGGMTTAELYQAVREEHRNLNIITFRAYLREFSDRWLLLEKREDRWQLTETVKDTMVQR